MKAVVFSLGLAGAVLLAAGPAGAQDQKPAPNPAESVFADLDKNGDGKVTADEIGEDQKRAFERLLRRGDADKDGVLTKDEFLKASQPETPVAGQPDRERRPGGRPGAEAGTLFEQADANKDGRVSLEELPERARERFKPIYERLGKDALTREEFARAFVQLQPQQAPPGPPISPEQFDRLDANKDGKLTKDEVPEEQRERFGQILERLQKDALTKEDLARMTRVPMFDAGALFERFDANKDGKLALEEFPEEIRPRYAPMFERLGKKEITREELERGMRQFGGGAAAGFGFAPGGGRAMPLVRTLDKNQDGRISKEEAARLAEAFDELDANKDGQLDLQELLGGGPILRGPPVPGAVPGAPNTPAPPARPVPAAAPPAGANPAAAAETPAAGAARRANRLLQQNDKDGDKKLSKEEAPERVKEQFDKIDTDGDGQLTLEELRAFRPVRPPQ